MRQESEDSEDRPLLNLGDVTESREAARKEDVATRHWQAEACHRCVHFSQGRAGTQSQTVSVFPDGHRQGGSWHTRERAPVPGLRVAGICWKQRGGTGRLGFGRRRGPASQLVVASERAHACRVPRRGSAAVSTAGCLPRLTVSVLHRGLSRHRV